MTIGGCGNEAPPKPAFPKTVRFCDQDIRSDTTMVTCSDPTVVGLAALIDLPSLDYISLRGTGVSDLSVLRNVSRVHTLDLSNTRVRDLSTLDPAIWTGLATLHLNETPVEDLTPLAALPSLVVLDVSGTPVTDLRPIETCTKLGRLVAEGTRATALPNMSRLIGLKHLNVDRTLIEDLSPLQDAPALKDLRASLTLVADVAPLAKIPTLEEVTIQDTLVPAPSVDELRRLRGNLRITHFTSRFTPDELRDLIIKLREVTPATHDAGAQAGSP
jgi:hypothetical protein